VKQNPEIEVEIGGETVTAQAKILDKPERSEVYARQAAGAPRSADYEESSGDRTIPMVEVVTAEPGSASGCVGAMMASIVTLPLLLFGGNDDPFLGGAAYHVAEMLSEIARRADIPWSGVPRETRCCGDRRRFGRANRRCGVPHLA